MREREIKHIATGTNPRPRGWTTSSSSWWPRGWWRWPSVMICPSDRVPERGLEWFFCGYRGLRWRNFWSRVIFDGFSIYRIFWRRYHVKMGLEVSTTHRGKPGAPWWVVPSSWLFWPSHEASGVSFVPKKSSKSFSSFEELSFLHKKQHHGSSAENSVSLG